MAEPSSTAVNKSKAKGGKLSSLLGRFKRPKPSNPSASQPNLSTVSVSCISPGPQAVSIQASTPQISSVTECPIFALVIGIDNYQDGSPTSLRGCVNDSRLMFTFFKDALHVPEVNVRHLTNEQATRENILESFECHFINNPAITQGDAIVFYFAGHGSRQRAPDGWHAEDASVETICPYDVAKASGIPDYTLTHLLRRLVHYKGNNITLIFDSCHSGGMGREELETDENAPLTRCYDPPDHMPALPADLDSRIWSWSSDDGRSTKPELPGSLYKSMETHVLLAACQPRQRARETKDSGKWTGAFTLGLLDSLRTWNPLTSSLTYLRLIEDLSPLDGQDPHCEGVNRVRRLFSPSNDRREDPSGFVVTAVKTATDNAYYVAAGYLLGIVTGTEFITHPPKDCAQITLTAAEVEECRCRVVPQCEETAPGDRSTSILPLHSRVTISKRRTKWLQVELEPRDAFPFITDDSDTLFSIVNSGGQLKASRVDGVSTTVQLVRKDPLISTQPECQSISVDLDTFDCDYLNRAAGFHFFLYQHNKPHNPSALNRISIPNHIPVTASLQPLLPNPTGPQFAVPSGDNLFRLSGLEDVRKTALAGAALLEGSAANLYYALTLENHTSIDLFPYVLFFDPRTYKIERVYLPHSSFSPPLTRRGTNGSTFGIGYGAQGTDKLLFSLPKGVDYDSGFFKIFVSATYINMEAILPTNERLSVTVVDSNITEKCWDSWVYLVTVRR